MFPYRHYDVEPTPANPDARTVHRPVIPFRAVGPKSTADFFGLLDSGADETYITREMADELGVVSISDERYTVESASGEMHVSYGRLRIEMDVESETHSWDAVVGVVPETWSEAILGHVGFMEYFAVSLSYETLTVELSRNARAFRP
jgi:hypothetical protein